MSLAQAQKFAETWTVIAQYTAPASGLSVTVFAPTSDPNARYLAIRGTEPALSDLNADGLLALGLPASLNPQYVALKAQIDQWRNDPAVLQGKTFSVAGHSLGGYLAAAVKQQYGSAVSDAYLYNAPGVLGPIGNILSLFGLDGASTTNVWNIRGSDGLSLLSGLGSALGTRVDVLTEPALNSHSIVLLTDALAVQALYARLAPDLAQDRLNGLLDASGVTADRSLEDALDALRALLLGPGTPPTALNDRQALYTNLQALQQNSAYTALIGTAQITPLYNASASDIASMASRDDALGLATRYALKALYPFALAGADYSTFNTDGELDLYDATGHPNGMSEQYLTDRANFLERKLWFSTEDINPVNPAYVYNGADHTFLKDATYFEDATTGYKIAQGYTSDSPYPNIHRYYFGNAQDNSFTGGAMEDHLYGGGGADALNGGDGNDYLVGNAGNDTLDGGQGADILLGGVGNDTYRYTSGAAAGLDTVLDSDGQGSLEIDGQAVTGGAQFGDARVYRDGAGRLYAKLDNQRLIVDGALVVENWQAGRLGIDLTGPSAETPTGLTTLTGNDTDNLVAMAVYDRDPDDPSINKATATDGSNSEWQFDSNVLGSDADILEGGLGNDILLGTATNGSRIYADVQVDAATAIVNGNNQTGTGQNADWLAGGVGDDILVGSAGNDVLLGGGGTDLLIAGAGDDLIYGDDSGSAESFDWALIIDNGTETLYPAVQLPSASVGGGADVIYAGQGDDRVWSGIGDDILFGEGGADQLIGAEGHDTLLGGDGQDRLWGNAGVDWLDGGAGNDELMGNDGADILIGGAGDDTYRFGFGMGRDTVIDTSDGGNVIELQAGMGFADLRASQSGNDLELTIRGTGQGVTVKEDRKSRRWRDGGWKGKAVNDGAWRGAA